MAEEIQINVAELGQSVSALYDLPENAKWLYVFAHGAGAGMRNAGMAAIAESLSRVGVATLRYNFPYMEQLEKGLKLSGQRFHKPPLLATVRAAVAKAAELAPDLKLCAGGKSMGGRMTSMAGSESPLPGVEKLIFYGFPLHPSGKPSIERAEHLAQVSLPMLFLQGDKDTLAFPDLIKGVCESLGDRATLVNVVGADHSFHVLKSKDAQVLADLAERVRTWLDS
jgi:uncharacterized protein